MTTLSVTIDGQAYTVEVPALNAQEDTITVYVNGEAVRVRLDDQLSEPTRMAFFLAEDHPYTVDYDRELRWLKTTHGLHRLDIRDQDAVVVRPATGDGRLKAPIPGLISTIRVEVGQVVAVDQPILVLEAMKMQNELRAPRAGVVASILVQQGETVSRAQVLVEIEAAAP